MLTTILTGLVCLGVGYGVAYLKYTGALKKIEMELDKGYQNASSLASAIRQHL